MNPKWILVLLIAVVLYALMHDRVEERFGKQTPGLARSDLASSAPTASRSLFQCALVGAGAMPDGFRGESYWRPDTTTPKALVCIEPALGSHSVAATSVPLY